MDPTDAMELQEVRRFIEGKTLIAMDPESNEIVATVTYNLDGSCAVLFPDGDKDDGEYGFVENRYWTRYRKSRQGSRNEFFLIRLGPDKVQAYYADGRRAFLQIDRQCA